MNHSLPRCFGFVACALTIFSLPAIADQCPADINELLQQSQNPAYQQLSFEVTHKGSHDNFSRSERYDASLPVEQRWVLLEKDGEPASEKQRAEFSEQKAKMEFPFVEMFKDRQLQEFELLENSAGKIRYTFNPIALNVLTAAGLMDVAEYISGELTILNNKRVGCVVNVNLRSDESFSPKFGVKVKNVAFTRRFVMDPQLGLFYPSSSVLALEGKAYVVANFDLLNHSYYTKLPSDSSVRTAASITTSSISTSSPK